MLIENKILQKKNQQFEQDQKHQTEGLPWITSEKWGVLWGSV